MKKILLEDVLILNAVRSLRFLVRVVPLRVSMSIGRGVGLLAYTFSKRRQIAYKNLRAVFASEKSPEELKRIARHSFQSMAMSAVELLRFPDMNKDYIAKHLRILGTEKFSSSLNQGKGVIFLTAHFGNWEFLNVAGAVLGYPMVALARVQKHPRSDAYLNSLRSSKGSRIVYKGMGVREILRSLKDGGIVGMLSDQDGGRGGVFVPFFGRLSSTPSGVATFAVRTGAPIYPVFIFREGLLDHRVEVEGPLEFPPAGVSEEEAERTILGQFAALLEQKIRKSPGEWLWAHRRWKSTPDRSVLILSDGKAGHLNQSLAVLEAIRHERAAKGTAPERLHWKVIEVRFKSGPAPKLFRLLGILTDGRVPFGNWWMRHILTRESYEAILKSYADIVISCGSSVAGLNLLVSAENQAKSVAVMRPPFSPGRFDAVIAPEHDHLEPKDNVYVTDRALSLISEEILESEADRFSRAHNIPRQTRKIGLLLGGDTALLKFAPADLEAALKEISRYAQEKGYSLLVTTSRRTPSWAETMVKRFFGGQTFCPLLVIASENNPSGTVAGILGLADAVVVTGESISMVSESIASGRSTVVIEPWGGSRPKDKVSAFLNGMQTKGFIRLSSSKDLGSALEAVTGSDADAGRADVGRDQAVLREVSARLVG